MNLTFFLFLLLVITGINYSAGQCTFKNPVKSGDAPDPFVMYKDGFYYGCHTTGGTNVQIYKSRSLQTIFNTKPVVIWGGKPDIWAPEIHYLNGKWYVYTSFNSGEGFNIVILEGDTQDAQGSYTLKAQFKGNNIDPDVWLDPDTKQLYMAYSRMDGISGMQEIWMTKMSNPFTREGDPVRLSFPVYSWEKYPYGVNEGPQFLLLGNKLHIAYSASQCHYENYCLGLLTAEKGSDYMNVSSWKKSDKPVFEKSPGNNAYAVGHHSCVQTPKGEWWMIYHGKYEHNRNGFADRDARMQKFYVKDDYPVFGIPVKTAENITCPDTLTDLCSNNFIYTNPVITAESPDPGVYYHRETGYYYVYNTNRSAFKSKDLVLWESIGNVLQVEGNPDLTWAPEVYRRKKDGKLYMFYTQDTKLLIAKSDSPEGPFTYHSGSLLNEWTIDSHFFQDDDGKEYMYWNTGGCSGTAGIWVGELNESLTGVVNPQHCFGAGTNPESWITECVREAPFMLKHKGTYYLVYSGNGTGPKYGIGYATATSPRGPWTINPDNPLMWDGVTGPGHCSFTQSPDSTQLLVFYHQWHDNKRCTSVDKAEFVDNDRGLDALKIYFTNKKPQFFPFCTNDMPIPCAEGQMPFKKLEIPGIIEVEDFDDGCQGDAFFDSDDKNNGGQYRETPIDIENTSDEGNGYNIGWLSTGEWLEYSVDVKENARYDMEIRVAAASDGNKFHVEFNGSNKTGVLTVNNTGGTQSWTTVKSRIALIDGKQSMKLFIDESRGGFNINKISFKNLSTYASVNELPELQIYPNPAFDTIFVENSKYPVQGIFIYNESGIKIYENNDIFTGEKPIKISNWSNGSYIMKVITGDKSVVKKFIKSNTNLN